MYTAVIHWFESTCQRLAFVWTAREWENNAGKIYYVGVVLLNSLSPCSTRVWNLAITCTRRCVCRYNCMCKDIYSVHVYQHICVNTLSGINVSCIMQCGTYMFLSYLNCRPRPWQPRLRLCALKSLCHTYMQLATVSRILFIFGMQIPCLIQQIMIIVNLYKCVWYHLQDLYMHMYMYIRMHVRVDFRFYHILVELHVPVLNVCYMS